jgi:hypothetical protein
MIIPCARILCRKSRPSATESKKGLVRVRFHYIPESLRSLVTHNVQNQAPAVLLLASASTSNNFQNVWGGFRGVGYALTSYLVGNESLEYDYAIQVLLRTSRRTSVQIPLVLLSTIGDTRLHISKLDHWGPHICF